MAVNADGKTVPASDLVDEMRALREKGWTFRDVGVKFGVSHERVRQLLGPSASRHHYDAIRAKTAARVQEVNDYLDEHPFTPRDEVMAHFGLTKHQMSTLVREGVDATKMLSPKRTSEMAHPREEIVEAIKRVWGEYRRDNPSAIAMSHSTYDAYRRTDDPSGALITSRYGWTALCEEADVPSGLTGRSPESYTSAWPRERILAVVCEFLDDCTEKDVRPSYLEYERAQKERKDWPSGSTVRNRLRPDGLATWQQIVYAALNRNDD